jgi:hypothetical protein
MTRHSHVASACIPPHGRPGQVRKAVIKLTEHVGVGVGVDSATNSPHRLVRPRARVARTVTQRSQHGIPPDLYCNGDYAQNVEVDAS